MARITKFSMGKWKQNEHDEEQVKGTEGQFPPNQAKAMWLIVSVGSFVLINLTIPWTAQREWSEEKDQCERAD